MKKKPYLSGKRFLITQPMIRSFCGSTMVTLELAEYLSSIGAKVTVYTNVALPPALMSFENAKIKVISSQDKYDLSLKDFDYVWVHSLTFPRQLLDELKDLPKELPAFVFLHMSPLDSIPDEHPWIYDLENSLSSLSLYISEKTLESNVKFGLPSNIGFFRNPAPLDFKRLIKRKISRVVKKVLIVSNHPPLEIMDAKKILEENNISVAIYGEGGDKYDPISPEILAKYDAVITIGKTVQYCIVGSLPVYIYDRFGGHGWLSESCYELSKTRNFSGRGFSKKTGNEIAQEIINGYNDALEFHLSSFLKNNNEFIIDSVLNELLSGLRPRKIKPFDSEYIESVKAAVGCAEIRFIASEELGNVYKIYDELVRELDEQKGLVQQLSEYRRRFEELSSSKRVKFLNMVLKPQYKIKDVLKKRHSV